MGRTRSHKKGSLDFITFCEKNGIEYRTTGNHTRRGWVQIDCPACGPGAKKFHLGYNIARGVMSCWRCGSKRIFDVLKAITGKRDSDIHGIINALPRGDSTPTTEKPTGIYTVPKGVKPMARCHRDYLRSRRFNPERIEDVWDVKGIGLDGAMLKWRLFIPITNNGVNCSWTTRTISSNPDITRYVSAKPEQERIGHKSLLYGEDFAGDTIIIVEGPMDAWRIGPGAVATFGTRPTPAQIIRMGRWSARYVCFDHGAERYAQTLVEALSVFPGTTHCITLDASDPDSMGRKELSQVRRLLE